MCTAAIESVVENYEPLTQAMKDPSIAWVVCVCYGEVAASINSSDHTLMRVLEIPSLDDTCIMWGNEAPYRNCAMAIMLGFCN